MAYELGFSSEPDSTSVVECSHQDADRRGHNYAQEPSTKPHGLGLPAHRRQRIVAFAANKSKRHTVAQTWLNQRLSGLVPADINPDGVAMYSTLQLEFPFEFAQCSRSIRPDHRFDDDELGLLQLVPALAIFCDIFDPEQLKLCHMLDRRIAALGDDMPPTILVPHSSSDTSQHSEDTEFLVLSEALARGLDNTVVGEPEGFKLAYELRSKIRRQGSYAATINDTLNDMRQRRYSLQKLEDNVHDMVWDYLRARLHLPLPKIDPSLWPCAPGVMVGQYQVGAEVGRGATGTVYTLHDPARAANGIGQVLKSISKKSKTDAVGLRSLANEVKVMLLLTQWPHPNLIQLYDVYHSETEMLFRMQDGGSMNLYNFIVAADHKRVALDAQCADGIINQCINVLCHLHLGPKIAHRDMKPENILVSECPGGVSVKLCDFDRACVARDDALHSFCCGTFPFTAPEIMRRTRYKPLAVDIWSMGMVILEVLCCAKVVTRNVLSRVPDRARTRRRNEETHAEAIYQFFERPGNLQHLMRHHVRSALQGDMEYSMGLLLENMLSVAVATRWTANDLQNRLCH